MGEVTMRKLYSASDLPERFLASIGFCIANQFGAKR